MAPTSQDREGAEGVAHLRHPRPHERDRLPPDAADEGDDEDRRDEQAEGGDADQMNEKAQALAQVAMKLGQAIYEKSQAAEASPQGDAGAEAPKDDVVDADFEEK